MLLAEVERGFKLNHANIVRTFGVVQGAMCLGKLVGASVCCWFVDCLLLRLRCGQKLMNFRIPGNQHVLSV